MARTVCGEGQDARGARLRWLTPTENKIFEAKQEKILKENCEQNFKPTMKTIFCVNSEQIFEAN